MSEELGYLSAARYGAPPVTYIADVQAKTWYESVESSERAISIMS
jgi:hypothetical protein